MGDALLRSGRRRKLVDEAALLDAMPPFPVGRVLWDNWMIHHARTLGIPWVHASPDGGQPSEVTIVVAWELSWYRYRVDLGDEHEPIVLVEKGDELAELEESLRAWNAAADENGRLTADVGSPP